MTVLAVLADAIRAAPDDDAPRLVYADAIARSDPERGELIALQCAIAAGTLARADAIVARRRAAALLAAHGDRWAGLAGIAKHAFFERGFIDHVSIDAAAFVARGDELIARAPALRQVDVCVSWHDRADHERAAAVFDAVVRTPAVRAVRTLGLHLIVVTMNLVDQLRATGVLRGLVGLSLHQLGYREQHLTNLARAGELAHLRDLELGVIDDDELAALAAGGGAPRRFFAFSPRPNGALAAAQLGELARDADDLGLVDEVGALPAAVRARLRRVVVRIDDPSLADVELPALRELALLDCTPRSPRDAAALAPLLASRGVRPRVLDLEADLAPDVMAALVASPLGRALEVIDTRASDLDHSADALRFDGIVLRR